ncbi:DNA-binding response regulator [Pseudomonas sp. FW215-R2]|jgi:two-component system response regulator EvgA|uniref:response regulator transcription factor n=1 Tax=unclassified Pseudomonas TaxID=196821 RepID=UPI000C87E524|nr:MULTISPECIES: response regulator transcription factor [unclassified Pseudomonas]PMW98653.1 DNA-binding response regulator [Pseudomonas sp. FW215-R2]PMX06832.1 DNA-binding response regulator [Pseudomonas sp. FW215-L1]PMX23436.1 DNA-binding response regulator [Pseudomonas sp. FW215-E1]PNA31005.1 DNA-binding response regulator [Pseudomonas sp. FW215-R4]
MDSALIVDDHPVVVGAVRMVLESLGYKPVHVASSGVDVVPMIRAHAPKLIVLDLKLTGMGGLEVLDRINVLGLVCQIVIFSSADPASYLVRCRRAGAMAFVAKSAELQQLQNAIKAVRSGYSYFQELPEIDAGHSDVHSDERQLIERLSNRELHILVQLAHGKANKRIAEEMNLSHKTISTYKTRLMLKLGMSSLVLLRELVKRNGLF